MPEPLIILGYARVSTREQAQNSHALEQHQARLKEAGVTEILKEVQSGGKTDRAQLKKLMELIEFEKVNEVIATRIDRLIVKT